MLPRNDPTSRTGDRFLQRIPLDFLSSGAVAGVLQCAALAARLDHREANSSVMKFLYDLTRAANNARPDRERIRSQCFT